MFFSFLLAMAHTVKFIYASASVLPRGMLYCQTTLPMCQTPMASSTWGWRADILWGYMPSLHLRTSSFSVRCHCHRPMLLRVRGCQVHMENCTHIKDVQRLCHASFAPAVRLECSSHWFSIVVISITSIITTSQIKPRQIFRNYPLIDAIFWAEEALINKMY